MSGIDEQNDEGKELYLKILYFSSLEAVIDGLVGDVISPKTVVMVQRQDEGAMSSEWNRRFLNTRAMARMGKVQLIEGYDALCQLFNYHNAGKQYMLW